MHVRDVRWTEANEERIAAHGVERHEVEDVVYDRHHHAVRVVANRYLSIVLEREQYGIFFVVTARDAAPKERRMYERHRRRD